MKVIHDGYFNSGVKYMDSELHLLIEAEKTRQENTIELIASENIVSLATLEVAGSILTNKYAEGYPSKRYYGGCEVVDKIEELAIQRVKQLFNVDYANVQAHSGSQANMAVYFALLQPFDKILGMDLSCGGHLTHGAKVSFSGKLFNFSSYSVNKDTCLIDYKEVEAKAIEHQPKLIIAGGSSYSRIIDFKKFREIADKVGAYLMVDMAHFAGLVAGGVYPSPINYAHVVTSTTHKTLRGPRGGIILSNNEDLMKKINSAIFPMCQGGPLMHIIGAKAQAFKEAMTVEYKEYTAQIIKNAHAMANYFMNSNINVISSGTDSHLFSINVNSLGVNGAIAEKILDSVNITCNKNSIPFDTLPPSKTSGLRIGTPAITTRGFKEEHCVEVASLIKEVILNINIESGLLSKSAEDTVKQKVKVLCDKFPIYK